MQARKLGMRIEALYKACKFEGEYVAIEAWFADGDSYMYRIRKIDGTNEPVHFSECSDFCLIAPRTGRSEYQALDELPKRPNRSITTS